MLLSVDQDVTKTPTPCAPIPQKKEAVSDPRTSCWRPYVLSCTVALAPPAALHAVDGPAYLPAPRQEAAAMHDPDIRREHMIVHGWCGVVWWCGGVVVGTGADMSTA